MIIILALAPHLEPLKKLIVVKSSVRLYAWCGADDVAVIDEAQMIANNERGFAWTRVLLGSCYT